MYKRQYPTPANELVTDAESTGADAESTGVDENVEAWDDDATVDHPEVVSVDTADDNDLEELGDEMPAPLRRSSRHRAQASHFDPTTYVGQASSSGPRRSGRTARPVVRLRPALQGQVHPDISMCQIQNHPNSMDNGLASCFTQVSLKRGLLVFGDGGVSAVESELRQLHARNSFRPICGS